MDEFNEFILGNSVQNRSHPTSGEAKPEESSSQKGWIESIISYKQDEPGLLDGADEDDSLLTKNDSLDDIEAGTTDSIKTQSTYREYFESAKTYQNTTVALIMVVLGIIMLLFAGMNLPLVMIFPGSFLRNVSLGSMFIFLALAFYMGPFKFIQYLMSEQNIAMASLGYTVCTLVSVYL